LKSALENPVQIPIRPSRSATATGPSDFLIRSKRKKQENKKKQKTTKKKKKKINKKKKNQPTVA